MSHDKKSSTAPVVEQNVNDHEFNRTSRRRFLTGSAVAVGAGAAAAVGFPSIAVAQTTTLRFQSTWPNQDIFHEFAADYVRIVNEMSGGRLRLNLLPAGAVAGGSLSPDDFRAPQGGRVFDGTYQCHGVLAVRRLVDLLVGVLAA